MEGPHYRKVELQSPADLSYLHVNTVSFAREKLDLHFPPSANNDSESDPMKERVRDLVDGVRYLPYLVPITSSKDIILTNNLISS